MKTKSVLWRELTDRYESCVLCPIGTLAHTHVFGRGHLSPEILFIGEGPGKLEDIKGLPFVGLAGQLLVSAIREAGGQPINTMGPLPVKCFFTNLVCCRPCDNAGTANRPPSEKEILNCKERLQQTVQLLVPKMIVLLGTISKKALANAEYLKPYKLRFMVHPAYVCRRGGINSPSYIEYVNEMKGIINDLQPKS